MVDPPRTVVHSEWTVYDGTPWLQVTCNEITTPDGINRSHHAIRLNTVATVIAVDQYARALLMRRHRWIVDAIGLESPGGIVETGEDPAACARRELLEETGFEVGTLVSVPTEYWFWPTFRGRRSRDVLGRWMVGGVDADLILEC
ncbi:NUDIX hydrolase [Nocardia rhizosphaerihabitans]|uniref:NUDIX hydrolase n=1 Tax=Nocardia rhizosphaerihabitans TaxID=1691570 RepID=UPI003670732B